ncbi:MAG: hypothetical protein JWL69_3936 [Phycisphaerales bacterium]|jgi:Uma2 family endonuclease|nr:hypothetical protein [Phycisphaerales bacterium]
MAQQIRNVLHPSASDAPSSIPYERFLEWDEDNQHVEWVDGKVIAMPPVSNAHQHLKAFLFSLMHVYTDARGLGEVRDDPFQMKTGPDLPGRAPDILFVAKENLGRLKKAHLDGPADLVVEIISPASRSTDRGEKLPEYEAGGVTEFWLLDPERKEAEFYVRGTDGTFHRSLPDNDGVFHSTVIQGLWIKLEWLWQNPRPAALAVLRLWNVI